MKIKLGKVLTDSVRDCYFKVIWPFDHVTNISLRDNLKNFLYQKTYGQKTWQDTNLRE